MLSTQSRTLIHRVPVLTPLLQISSLTLTAEGVYVIPSPPCSFCDSSRAGAFFQAEQQMTQLVWQYPLSDFTLPPPGLGGNVLIMSESGIEGADTSLVTVDGE